MERVIKKVTKSYVQKMYSDPRGGGLYVKDEEVKERNPMQFKANTLPEIQGFRFYDIEFVIDGSKVYTGEKENYSKWVYFGKRISRDEFKREYPHPYSYSSKKEEMEAYDYQFICHTQGGNYRIMQEGDMTYDELVAQKEHDKEKSDNEVKKEKYTLMKEGLILVKPATAEEWLEYVDYSSNNESSLLTVKLTISMMKKFEEGLSFEEAEQQVYNEELELSEVMLAEIANVLSHFAENGEEYRRYWYRKKWNSNPKNR